MSALTAEDVAAGLAKLRAARMQRLASVIEEKIMSEAGVIPPPQDRNPMVREAGRLKDMDDLDVVIGVNYDTVTVDAPDRILTQAMAEEFGRLFVTACWEAGANKRRMDAEVVDATIHAAGCANPGCEGECDG